MAEQEERVFVHQTMNLNPSPRPKQIKFLPKLVDREMPGYYLESVVRIRLPRPYKIRNVDGWPELNELSHELRRI